MSVVYEKAVPQQSIGWEWCTLGDLCRIELGSTPARRGPENWDSSHSSGNVWLSIADMPTGVRANAQDSKEYVSDKAARRMKLIPKGTLLASFKLTLGRLCFAGTDLYTNEAIAALHDIDTARISKDFLYWYLTYFDWDAAAAGDHKIKGKTLNKKKLKALAICIPPLEEQKRIVAILDQAFAALNRARAHAEANLADAELLRRRGASRLLSRYEILAPKKLLGQLAEFRNGLNFSRHSSGATIKVVGVGDFKRNFSVPVDELQFATIDDQLLDNDRLCAGDVLAVRSNGNKELVGRVMVMGDADEVVSYSGFVIRIRLTVGSIDPRYLCYYMKSDEAIAHLRAGGGGANISNLNQRVLSSLPVSVPSVEEQRGFVDSMNLLNTKAKTLIRVAESKLADIADLRQTLLQKAFAGELS